MFDITNNKYRSWFVKFVDISDDPDDVLDYITDYDHLNLHYDRLCGKKIGSCMACGKLFKQSDKRPAMYCYKHRGYRKSGKKTLTCVDCGKEFEVGSKSRLKIRCSNCQRIKHLNDIKTWKMNHNNKKEKVN